MNDQILVALGFTGGLVLTIWAVHGQDTGWLPQVIFGAIAGGSVGGIAGLIVAVVWP